VLGYACLCWALSVLLVHLVAPGDAATDLEAALTKALDETLMPSCFYNLGLCKVNQCRTPQQQVTVSLIATDALLAGPLGAVRGRCARAERRSGAAAELHRVHPRAGKGAADVRQRACNRALQ
jgi:hypothetical protein